MKFDLILSLAILTIGILTLFSIAQAQTGNDESTEGKSMVDELTENLQKQQKKDQSYKEELINRLTGENSTCTYIWLGGQLDMLIDVKDLKLPKEKVKEEYRKLLDPIPVDSLVSTFKLCLEEGKVK